MTIGAFLLTTRGFDSTNRTLVAIVDVAALGLGLPFVYTGCVRIADPGLSFLVTDYKRERATFGGQDGYVTRATGSSRMMLSRRGAIGFASVGLVLWAGAFAGAIALAGALRR